MSILDGSIPLSTKKKQLSVFFHLFACVSLFLIVILYIDILWWLVFSKARYPILLFWELDDKKGWGVAETVHHLVFNCHLIKCLITIYLYLRLLSLDCTQSEYWWYVYQDLSQNVTLLPSQLVYYYRIWACTNIWRIFLFFSGHFWF